jgi:hypothetical protein
MQLSPGKVAHPIIAFISASSVNSTGGELAPLDCSDGASVALEKWVEPQLSWEVGVMTRRNASLEIRHVTVVSYLSPDAAGI